MSLVAGSSGPRRRPYVHEGPQGCSTFKTAKGDPITDFAPPSVCQCVGSIHIGTQHAVTPEPPLSDAQDMVGEDQGVEVCVRSARLPY